MGRLTLLILEILLLAAPAVFVLLVSTGFSHRTTDLFHATYRHNGEIFAVALTLWALLLLRFYRDRRARGPKDEGATPSGAIHFHNILGLAATGLFYFLHITQGFLETPFTERWLPGIALVSLGYAIFWTVVYDLAVVRRRRVFLAKARE